MKAVVCLREQVVGVLECLSRWIRALKGHFIHRRKKDRDAVVKIKGGEGEYDSHIRKNWYKREMCQL